MSNSDHRKKVSITKLLVGFTLLLIVFACGGGVLYLDYYSGSYAGSILQADESHGAIEVNASSRGLDGGVASISGSENIFQVTVRDEEFTVSRDAVIYHDNKVAELPQGTKSVEIEHYRGAYRIIVDGNDVTNNLAVGSDE